MMEKNNIKKTPFGIKIVVALFMIQVIIILSMIFLFPQLFFFNIFFGLFSIAILFFTLVIGAKLYYGEKLAWKGALILLTAGIVSEMIYSANYINAIIYFFIIIYLLTPEATKFFNN